MTDIVLSYTPAALVLDPITLASYTTISVPSLTEGAVPDAPSFTLPDLAGVPSFSGVDSYVLPTLDTVPTLDALLEPIITLPSTPSLLTAPAPGAAPSFNTVVLPDAPVVSMPTAPTFTPVALPTAPTFVVPTFDDAVPTDIVSAPYTELGYSEQLYSSDLLDVLKADIDTALTSDTTGIVADEAGLMDRARSRVRDYGQALLQDADNVVASVGGLVPPDTRAAMLQTAAHTLACAASATERSITLKHNELRVTNRSFALEAGSNFEQTGQEFYNRERSRALQVAKARVDYALAVFDAQVTAFKTKLERYKVAASVYETRIRAANLILETYRTKVQATSMQIDMQRLYAEIYNMQLHGVEAYVNIYKTRMEAARVASQVEQLKLEGFRASIEAYTAQVNAKAVEARLYESRLRGETSKVDIYAASVEAYKSRVDAYRATVQARSVVTNAEVAAADLKLEACKASLAGYTEQLQTLRVRNRAKVENYRDAISLYSARTELEPQRLQAVAGANEANARLATRAADIYKDYAIGLGKLAVDRSRIASDEAIAKARISNSQSIARARIASSEYIALAHNQSSERISTTQNSMAEAINRGHIIASESNAMASIWTHFRVGMIHLASQEYTAINALAVGEFHTRTTTQVELMKSYADAELRAVTIATNAG